MAPTEPVHTGQQALLAESVAGGQLFGMEGEILTAAQVHYNGVVKALDS